MIVNATTSSQELQRALEELGAVVTWPAEATRTKAAKLEVEVDDDDAWEALPSRYYHDDDVDQTDPAEPWDVGDFVAACTLGDRSMALALADRVFVTDRNRSAVASVLGRVAS